MDNTEQRRNRIQVKTKDKIKRDDRRREEKFVKGYQSLMEGQELGDVMDAQADVIIGTERRKRQMEYRQWKEEVSDVIADNIAKRLEARPYHTINERKRAEFQQFLDMTNVKGNIFRDIIIESEYDPLEANRQGIKCNLKRFNMDPTRRAVERPRDEKAVLSEALAAEGTHMSDWGRDSLDNTLWGDLLIKSTPHGHFSKLMARKDPNKPVPKSMQLTHVMDRHFDRDIGHEITDSEFPLGKRCGFPDDHQNDFRNSSLNNYNDEIERCKHILRH
jgi:hypothetical protein